MQSYMAATVEYDDTTHLYSVLIFPSHFKWVSVCAHSTSGVNRKASNSSEMKPLVLRFPGFRTCEGIQVPIIFTSNVNQRTRTCQSPTQPFGMEMGCIHRNAAILAADEMARLGLIKISPQIRALQEKPQVV